MSPVARCAPPTLGVVAIARNEERDMPAFLEHLLPWVDEIVIVDDGSTDRTREIAAAVGDKVRLVSRRMSEDGGFAQQRNAGIDIARSDWLLHMDIDERVTPQLAAEIGSAIADARGNAFRYRRLNFFLHRPMNAGGWQRWNKPQLARRGAHRFVGLVHEECVIEGGAKCIGQLTSAMWHLNDEDYSERVQKNARYMQMSGDELLAGGRKIRWYHLLAQPLWRALRAYFPDGAFRLGTRGLLFSVYTFCSVFNWYAYAWDKQNRIERAELEAELARQWRAAWHDRQHGGHEPNPAACADRGSVRAALRHLARSCGLRTHRDGEAIAKRGSRDRARHPAEPSAVSHPPSRRRRACFLAGLHRRGVRPAGTVRSRGHHRCGGACGLRGRLLRASLSRRTHRCHRTGRRECSAAAGQRRGHPAHQRRPGSAVEWTGRAQHRQPAKRSHGLFG